MHLQRPTTHAATKAFFIFLSRYLFLARTDLKRTVDNPCGHLRRCYFDERYVVPCRFHTPHV